METIELINGLVRNGASIEKTFWFLFKRGFGWSLVVHSLENVQTIRSDNQAWLVKDTLFVEPGSYLKRFIEITDLPTGKKQCKTDLFKVVPELRDKLSPVPFTFSEDRMFYILKDGSKLPSRGPEFRMDSLKDWEDTRQIAALFVSKILQRPIPEREVFVYSVLFFLIRLIFKENSLALELFLQTLEREPKPAKPRMEYLG